MDYSVAFLLTRFPCPYTPHTVLITCDRPPAEFIPPVQEPYQYIIFRASEVKDLAVDEPTPRRSVHDDPAVLGVRVSSSFVFHWYCATPCVMNHYGCKRVKRLAYPRAHKTRVDTSVAFLLTCSFRLS